MLKSYIINLSLTAVFAGFFGSSSYKNDPKAIVECIPDTNTIAVEPGQENVLFEARYNCGVLTGERGVLHNFFRFENGLEFHTQKPLDSHGLAFHRLSVSSSPDDDMITLRGYVDRIPSRPLTSEELTNEIEIDTLFATYNDNKEKMIQFPLKISPPKESSICYTIKNNVVSRMGREHVHNKQDIKSIIDIARKNAEDAVVVQHASSQWISWKPVEKDLFTVDLEVACERAIDHKQLFSVREDSDDNPRPIATVFSDSNLNYVISEYMVKPALTREQNVKLGEKTVSRHIYDVQVKIVTSIQPGDIGPRANILDSYLPTKLEVRLPFTFKNPSIFHASAQREWLGGATVYDKNADDGLKIEPTHAKAHCTTMEKSQCHSIDTEHFKNKVSAAVGLSKTQADIKLGICDPATESEPDHMCATQEQIDKWTVANSDSTFASLSLFENQKEFPTYVPVYVHFSYKDVSAVTAKSTTTTEKLSSSIVQDNTEETSKDKRLTTAKVKKEATGVLDSSF